MHTLITTGTPAFASFPCRTHAQQPQPHLPHPPLLITKGCLLCVHPRCPAYTSQPTPLNTPADKGPQNQAVNTCHGAVLLCLAALRGLTPTPPRPSRDTLTPHAAFVLCCAALLPLPAATPAQLQSHCSCIVCWSSSQHSTAQHRAYDTPDHVTA